MRSAVRAGLVLAGVLAAALAVGGAASAGAQASGPVLVDEDFTGAAAPGTFQAFGSACLTGAPPVLAAELGEHPLTGCPETAVGPVPPNGGAPYGYLRLTDASHDQAGALLYDSPVPSSTGVEITFEQWQYGSNSQFPADGISFFLVDGDASLDQPGAFGGSLGYAQKLPDDNPVNEFIPGVVAGYLGIGFDVLGNYFGDWEQRGNGCDLRSPAGTSFQIPAPGANMVTVRGPGAGSEGYCLLTATSSNFSTTGPWPSTLPGPLHGPLTSLPPDASPADAAALLEPSKRTVTVVITPAPAPMVTVSIDFQDGVGSQQVLQFPAPEPVPATYKLGFAASTGLFTDVHLIRTLRVQALAPLPALQLEKRIATGSVPAVAGTEVQYAFTVTNTGGTPLSAIVVDDPLIADVTCVDTDLGPGEPTACSGTYTLTAADVQAGQVHNVAVARGASAGGLVESSPAEVMLTLQRPAVADEGTVTQLAASGVDMTHMLIPALLALVIGAGALLPTWIRRSHRVTPGRLLVEGVRTQRR